MFVEGRWKKRPKSDYDCDSDGLVDIVDFCEGKFMFVGKFWFSM